MSLVLFLCVVFNRLKRSLIFQTSYVTMTLQLFRKEKKKHNYLLGALFDGV